MNNWKKFLILSLSFLFVVTSVLAGLVNFVKVDDTSNNSDNQESGVVTPSSPNDYDGMIYYASENEETGASVAPRETKGGAVYVGNGSTFVMDGGVMTNHECLYGGAVYVANGGTFTMTGGTIEYNYSMYGGAVYVEAGGTFIIEDGDIINNMSENAPAIYVEAGGHVKISADAYIVANEYIEVQDTMINYYVDGVHRYSRNQLLPAFNLGKAPLDYEHCNGYFLDEGMTIPVEQNDDLTEIETGTSVQSMVAQTTTDGMLEYNLYTYTATPELFEYTLVDDTHYSVAKKAGSVATKYVLPKTYENKNVDTLTASMFNGDTKIETLYLSSLIKVLPENVLKGATKFVNVNLTNNIETLGGSVFYNCTALKEITIPESVTSIGIYAFRNCTGLTTLNYNASVTTDFTSSSNIFSNCGSENGFVVNINSSCVPAYFLYNNTKVTEVNLNSVTNIRGYSFNGCTALTSLTIPNSVTSIGFAVFSQCKKLKRVVMSNSVEQIDNSLFYDCSALEYIELSSNIESISSHMFYHCSSLKEITIPNSVTSIGDHAFSGCTKLENVINSDNVDYIDKYAFSGCIKLVNVTNSDNVEYIGGNAFNGCSSLTSFSAGSDITIGSYAFKDCSSLESFDYDGEIKSLGNYAFENSGLTSIDIEMYTSPGLYAFSGCTDLKEVNCYIYPYDENTNIISENMFSGCTSLKDVYIDDHWDEGAYETYDSLDECHEAIDSISNKFVIAQSAFYNCTSLETIDIPSCVSRIRARAFEGCTSLTTVNFDTADYFYYYTYTEVGLTYEDIACIEVNNLTDIDAWAFKGCTSLTSITLPDRLEVIRAYAFQDTGINNVTIPSSCYMVGKCAFANDSLQSVIFESESGWYFSNPRYGSETTAEQGTSADVSSPTANAQMMKDMASGALEEKHLLKKPVV